MLRFNIQQNATDDPKCLVTDEQNKTDDPGYLITDEQNDRVNSREDIGCLTTDKQNDKVDARDDTGCLDATVGVDAVVHDCVPVLPGQDLKRNRSSKLKQS